METEALSSDAGPSTVSYPKPPTYVFDAAPSRVTTWVSRELQSEVQTNFFRSARWCPDGSAVLTTSEDRVFRLIDTPDDAELPGEPDCRSFAQPDAIHASLWYPTASLSHPETFCFAASIRDTPVRLIDAGDGRIRASYPIVDHRERFIAPHSLAFSPDATRLYCGCENAIEVLDIASPGPGGSERIKTSSTKRDKVSQKGIISALAFSTDYSGLFAAGSFNGSVSLYQEDHDGAVGHLDGIVGSGVTQVQFHPLSPNHLVVASRRCDLIQVYDLRNPTEAIGALPRKGDTNQRLSFDIDPWGRYITTGDRSGRLSVWDINSAFSGHETEAKPLYEKDIARDAIGSVQLHPFKPYLLAVAGSRRQTEQYDDSDGSSDPDVSDDSSAASQSDDESLSPKQSSTIKPQALDAVLRIWSFDTVSA